jgi:hypothetical protein
LSLACIPARSVAVCTYYPPSFGTTKPTKTILETTADKLPAAASPHIPANLKSKFVGVNWHRKDQKWRAQIMAERKKTHIEYYLSEEEAARAYDERAGALGRPVNFPKKGQKQAESHQSLFGFIGIHRVPSGKHNVYCRFFEASGTI